jgi:hypothetical protein
MVWMIVVGVTVIVVKPLWLAALCPAAVPTLVADFDSRFDCLLRHGGGIIGYAAVLWALLGYVVMRSESREPSPAPQATVE